MRRPPVPAATAVALGIDDARRGVLEACTGHVAERSELDLDAVAARWSDEAAVLLADYWGAARRLWRDHQRGEACGWEVVVLRVPRGSWHQQTGRDKADLRAQYQAIMACGGESAELCDAALSVHPDGELELSLMLPGGAIPTELGGVLGPGEIRRELVCTIRWAKWRDRKVRRLASVHAFAHEIWPDPTPWRDDWLAATGGV